MSRQPSAKVLIGLLIMVISVGGCSRAETQRIAGETVRNTIRSACSAADNCTQDCSAGTAPPGAKCTETP